MEFLWNYLLPFLAIVTILVFVHEMGHYYVARRNGVRVEVFSIGFGPEIYGRTDKAGTRWKFSAIPLGGYVKMFGDADVASTPGAGLVELTEEEKAVAFHYKPLGQRAAIVFAGPFINYVFAVVVLAGLFVFGGQPFTPAKVNEVLPDTAALDAGIKAGDLFVEIDGRRIERFEDVRQIVALSPGVRLKVVVLRDGKKVPLFITPRKFEITDKFDNVHVIGRLGVRGGIPVRTTHDPFTAVWRAVEETYNLTHVTFKAIGQMIAGTRTTKELGGPLRIAEISGDMAQSGLYAFVWFLGVLSLHLCLINLLPIPMLDGGHLLFYAIEWVRGRPLGDRAQEFGFRIGLALVLTLMLFVTWNDLVHLRVVEFFKNLVT